MKRTLLTTLLFLCLGLFVNPLWAQEDVNSTKESPWLLMPLISSSPKLGTSIGAMAGYLYKFDEDSPTSTFSVMGNYSSSDSVVMGVFTKTYFDHNQQRLVAGFIRGEVNNEYNDFLGIGAPSKTTDDFHALFTRYSYRFFDNVFIGGQFVATNYIIVGDSFSQPILDFLGLNGFKSNGLGLTAEYDSRDNINSPHEGSFINLSNIVYREALGGDENFEVYDFRSRHYFEQLEELVLALRLDGKWTSSAPAGAYSSVDLRGYTKGQYLAPNSTSFEVEERLDIAYGIGATLFTGVSCLYDGLGDCSDTENLFPSIGGGLNYMIKKEEKMIVRLEGALGKGDTYGVYLQFGRAF